MTTVAVLITVGVAILTALITWLITWYYTGRKKLSVLISTTNVIKNNDKYKHLKISYNESIINELNHTKITIKNIGNKDIIESDILTRLIVNIPKDFSIYEYSIEDITKEGLLPKAEILNNNELQISFNYLENKDGFTVILLHDYIVSPKFTGKINNCKISFDKIKTKKEKFKNTVLIVGLIYSIFFVVFSKLINKFSEIPTYENYIESYTKTNNQIDIISTFLAIIMIVMIITYYFISKHYTKKKIKDSINLTKNDTDTKDI